MKCWLALVCVLGSLCGGVFTMYSAVSVGSDGLTAMADSLKSIGGVMDTYYRNLNNARSKVMPAIFKLESYVNTTYTSLNDSYRETQPNMESMVTNLEWFTQHFHFVEQEINTKIGTDLSQLNSQLQQTIDQILQNYNMLVSSVSYQQKAENCNTQYAGSASSIPYTLSMFGRCLQIEIDTVPTVVAPLLAIFKLVQNDLTSLNKQLKICASTSTNCINQYFMDIYNELYYVNLELYMAQSLLNFYHSDASQRNMLCGELIKSNVQDATQNLMSEFSQCMNPPIITDEDEDFLRIRNKCAYLHM